MDPQYKRNLEKVRMSQQTVPPQLGGCVLPAAERNRENWRAMCFVRRSLPSQTPDLLLNGSRWIPLHNYLKKKKSGSIFLVYHNKCFLSPNLQISSRLARSHLSGLAIQSDPVKAVTRIKLPPANTHLKINK